MNRLRSSADIERVRREGRSYAHPLVVVITAKALEDASESRRAVVAGRRIGGAVVRNRAKRLLREAVRHEGIKPGWDVMLVARSGIVGARLSDVQAAVHLLLKRAELLS